MHKLQYFKGKVCTILTQPVARFYEPDQFINTFCGMVDEVDEFGVWIIQLSTKRKSFFAANTLVGIIEELATPLTEEQAHAIRSQMENRLPDKNPQQMISVDKLNLIKRNAKGKNQ